MPSSTSSQYLLVVRHQDGSVVTYPLPLTENIDVTESADYAVIEATTGESPEELILKRDGEELLVEVSGDLILVLDGYFLAEGAQFVPQAQFGSGSLAGEPLDLSTLDISGDKGPDGGIIWSAKSDDGGSYGAALGAVAFIGGTALLVNDAISDSPDNNTVTGKIVAGPVIEGNGLTVEVYQADGETLLGSAKVDPSGSFTLDVGDYTGAVVARVLDSSSAADYLDEATGENKDLNVELSAVAVIVEPNSTIEININAATTLAANLALSGVAGKPLTVDAVEAANRDVAELFSLEDLHAIGVSPTNGGTFDVTDGLDAEEVYGLILAAFSGADLNNGGDSQATLENILSELGRDQDGRLTLSAKAQEELQLGAGLIEDGLNLPVSDDMAVLVDTVAPAFVSGAAAESIGENGGPEQVIYSAEASDAATVTYSLKETGDHALLSIDAQTGAVTLVGNPDHETQASYQFTVVATDAAGNASEQAVSLDITDLDESAPSITSGATAKTIDENSGVGQVIYTATATDTADVDDTSDTSGEVTYSLKETGDHALLAIDSATGEVTLSGNPDHETQASYQFTVVATDEAGNSAEQAVSLDITDLDESTPSFTSGDTVSAIDENSGAGQVIYTATATDTADGDDATDTSTELSYSLKETGDHTLLSIDAQTGAVTLVGNPDHETQASYQFTVVATDAAGNASEQAVSLDITDLDESAPSITSGATAKTIDENSGVGQVIYTASATDTADVDDTSDTSGEVTYSLKETGDHALLAIDSATGEVTLSGNPDHETQASYQFTVVATDEAGNSAEQAVSLDINDLDESAPVFTSAATATAIDENSGAGQVIYTATATDTADGDDATDTSTELSYSLKETGDHTLLSIDAQTGAVTLVGNPDHETQASYQFTVVATDAAGNASEQAVSLDITDLDESAPSITSGATAKTIDENSGVGQVIYTASATDTADVDDTSDTSGEVTYSLKETGDHALLAIDSATGEVTLSGNPDHETQASYQFTVVATDEAGNSAEQAVSLDITDLDESTPVFTSGDTASAIDENSGAGQVIYTATATDTADVDDTSDTSGELTYSLKEAGDHALLAIDSATGEVTLSGNPDHETQDSYQFTVVATDTAGNATEQTVSLDINDLDESAPVFTSAATATAIDENSGAGQVIYTATSTDDGDVSSGSITYSLETSSDPALSIDAASGKVTLTVDPDFETQESYSFTVVATDEAGNSSDQAVTLSINDIADETSPTITSVAITSATGAQNSILTAGDIVTVTVMMDEATVVDTTDGTPRIALTIGEGTVYANYASGSGGNALLFTYAVQAGEADSNGIGIPANALDANGASLRDTTGNAAILSHAAVADNTDYRVDTEAPVASVVLEPETVQLEPDGVTNGFDYYPQLTALGSEGAFVVTWYGRDAGGDNSIFVQRFDTDGAAVGTPILLEPAGLTDGDDYYPQLTALGNEGAFVVTWQGRDAGGDSSIFVQRFDTDGAAMGTPILLEPDGVSDGSDSQPQLTALGSEGAFVVTWYGQDAGGDNSIFVQRFDTDGAAVGAPILLEPAGLTDGYDYYPQLTVLGNEDAFVVTWRGRDAGGDNSIFVQRFDTDGAAMGTPILLEPDGVSDGSDSQPQLTALGSEGAFVVTWYGRDAGGDNSIFVQRFDTDGAAVGTPILLEPNGVADGPDYNPQLTALGNEGAFVVTWYGRDAGGDFSIFVQRFDTDGKVVGTPTLLEPDGVANGYDNRPQLTALGSNGAFAVTWYGQDANGDYSVFVQRFDTDGAAAGTPILLEPDGVADGQDQYPQLTALGSEGAFVVTWYGEDANGDYSIFVQRFNADGTPVGASNLIRSSDSISVSSTETGTAYLVHDSLTVSSVEDITSGADDLWNSVAITAANTSTTLAATGLSDGEYRVYTVDAAGNLSSAAETTITIDSTAPEFSSEATAAAIDENSGTGQVVYTADATDISVVNYSLKAVGDYTRFTIDETTGQVTLTDDPDFETQESYSFTVVATDAAGNSSEQAVTLGINDIAESSLDTSIVVFDMVQGVSSEHSGRNFQPDVSYEIYVRVDSDGLSLSTAGNGPGTWGTWNSPVNLGSDDKIIVVGDGSPIIAGNGVAVDRLWASSSWVGWVGGNASAVGVSAPGDLYRGYSGNWSTVQLWSNGGWASAPGGFTGSGYRLTGAILGDMYFTNMPSGILTSQGLV